MVTARLVPALVLLWGGCFVSPTRLDEVRAEADTLVDSDGDGFAAEDDCDDSNPDVAELATFYADLDGDGVGDASVAPVQACTAPEGHATVAGDCDDLDDERFPGNPEVADDDVDQDCDGVDAASCYADADRDGAGRSDAPMLAPDGSCDTAQGEASSGGDCADDDAGRFPGNTEVPGDGIDQDCDFVDASPCFTDSDQDGFGDPTSPILVVDCASSGGVSDAGDCHDGDETVHPGAFERCDGQSNACEGAVPIVETDVDGDGYVECEGDLGGWDGDPTVIGWGDCDPDDVTIHPFATELCDGKVNRCGFVLSPAEIDGDNDSFVDCTFEGGVTASTWGNAEVPAVTGGDDCNDSLPAVFPGAPERCDGRINACGGALPGDEIDDDNDRRVECTFAPGVTNTNWANAESPTVIGDGDCDDTLARTWPGATEYCDGLDNDCDLLGDATDPDVARRISRETSTGVWSDITPVDPTVRNNLVLGTNGTAWLCPGTHYVRFHVSASAIALVGRYGPDVTILSGRQPPPSSTPTSQMVDVSSTGSVRVEGLTLEGGLDYNGGAMRMLSASAVDVVDCVFDGNEATNGGGLYVTGNTVAVSGTTFVDGVASRGGAVYVNSGTVAVTGGEMVGNTAAQLGGAIHVQDGVVTVTGATLSSNVSDGQQAGGGGAISMSGGSLTATGTVIEGNEALFNDGGGILVGDGASATVTLTDSVVTDNVASDWGGGIACEGSCAVVANNTMVSYNTAGEGGGVMLADNDSHFTCLSTPANAGGVIGNTATESGGGTTVMIGGGVGINASSATVDSTRCDWGVFTEQNAPTDIGFRNGWQNYGGNASFSCSFDACFTQ